MLQTMRQLAQSWVFKGLMMILVVSFGIWGIGDIFRGNPLQRTVAKVGGEAIPVVEVQRQFDTMLTQMRRSFGPDVTVEQAKSLGLLDKALEALVTRKQIDLEAKHLGIAVTDKQVVDWLMTQPELRNKDGSLDRDAIYREAEREGVREADFIHEWEGLITERELFYPFAHSGGVPATIIDAITKAQGQKRILDVITIANDSMQGVPAPTDKELHDFYAQNPQTFTAPEYRAITIAVLSTNDITKDMAISDDEVKKEYDTHLAQYAAPERRDIVQVLLPDADKAKQLATAAQASGNLTAAATAMSFKPEPINQVQQDTLPPSLAAPIFALKPGQVSNPIQSELGWHVIQLKSITPAGTAPFDKVKNELRDTMRRDRAADVAAQSANQLDDALAGGRSLEDIADSLHMHLIKIPGLDAHGKLENGKDPADLPDHKDVLDAAFAQGAGETSPVIDDKSGNYIVVRTDQITPSGVRPFDKIRDDVAAAWKAQQQETRAAAAADRIAKELRGGKPPSAFAAEAGVEVRVSKPISRLGDNDPSLPASLLPQIEKLKKGEVTTAAIPGHEVVLRLAQVVDLDKAAVEAAAPKVDNDLERQTDQEFIGEYRDYLRDQFPPTVNQDVFDAMRQQGS
jgi:peptidyl-prolyl cis-trans isomerase D